MKNLILFILLIFCGSLLIQCKTKKVIPVSEDPTVINKDQEELSESTTEKETDQEEPTQDPPTPAGQLTDSTQVKIASAAEHILQLSVIDEATRLPVNEVTVTVISEKTGKSQEHNPSEDGKIVLKLAAGCYKIMVWGGNFSNLTQRVCTQTLGVNNASSTQTFALKSRPPASTTGEPGKNPSTDPNETSSNDPGKKDVGKNNKPNPNPLNPGNISGNEDRADLDKIELAHTNLIQMGRFRFDSIPQLPVDTTYIFKLEIIPGSDTTLFEHTNQSGRGYVEKEIRVGSEMVVHIKAAPEHFDITALSDTVQPLEPFASTLWSWTVRPKMPGKHPVTLSIDLLLKGSESQELRRKHIRSFNKNIEVIIVEEAKPPIGPGSWLWWMLSLAALLAIVLFVYLRKRKQVQKEEILLTHPALPAFIAEVEEEVAEGNTEDALEKMIEFFKEKSQEIYTQTLTLSAQYHEYRRSLNLGLNPPAETVNRINLAIVELLGNVRNKINAQAES